MRLSKLVYSIEVGCYISVFANTSLDVALSTMQQAANKRPPQAYLLLMHVRHRGVLGEVCVVGKDLLCLRTYPLTGNPLYNSHRNTFLDTWHFTVLVSSLHPLLHYPHT